MSLELRLRDKPPSLSLSFLLSLYLSLSLDLSLPLSLDLDLVLDLDLDLFLLPLLFLSSSLRLFRSPPLLSPEAPLVLLVFELELDDGFLALAVEVEEDCFSSSVSFSPPNSVMYSTLLSTSGLVERELDPLLC